MNNKIFVWEICYGQTEEGLEYQVRKSGFDYTRNGKSLEASSSRETKELEHALIKLN